MGFYILPVLSSHHYVGATKVVSDFPACDIEGSMLELESRGHDMEFFFKQVAESLKEFDDNDEGDSTVALDIQCTRCDRPHLIAQLRRR